MNYTICLFRLINLFILWIKEYSMIFSFITFSCLQSTLAYPKGVCLSTACLYKYGRNRQGAHIMKIDLVLDITM